MKFLFLILLSLNLFCLCQKNIIFELDLFFEVDEIRHTKETSIFASLFENSINYYSEKFLDIVNNIKDFDEYKQDNLYYKNKLVPSFICAYQLDVFDSNFAIKRIEQEIKKVYSHFSIERNILLHAAKVSFNPEHEISCMFPLQKNMKIALQYLANTNNRVFILTNKNSNTMQTIQKKYNDFFSQFDKNNIIYSGQLKYLKPNIKTYLSFLNKFNLNPSDCYFIESEQICVDSIKQIPKINVVLCNNKDFKCLEEKLDAI